MKRVTGLGGVFYKCQNKELMLNWYRTHLGIDAQDWGAMFPLSESFAQHPTAYNVWSLFKAETTHFAPSTSSFMINFTVANLTELLAQLRLEGVEVLDKTEDGEYGKFGWLMDPEGNKIELWEPPVEG